MKEETRAPGLPEHGQEGVKTGFFTLGPRAFRITRATDVFSGMLGYPPEELVSLTLPEIWPDEAERERFCRSIDEQSAVAGYLAELARRDGSLLPVTIAASSFPDTDITCIVSSRPCEQDEERTAEHPQVFNALVDAVLILDRDGSTLFANTAAAAHAGLSSPADLSGRNLLQFVHPDYAEAVISDLKNVRSGHDSYLAHYLMRDLHGNDKWIEGLGTKILFRGREANLVTLREITERKSVEGELARTNQQSRDLYRLARMMCDNVPDLIWAKDMEGRYLFANRALCDKLLNAADTDEPVGKTGLFFAERERLAHSDDPAWHTFDEICRDSDAIVMESGEPMRFDEYGNIKGEFLFLDVNKAPFRDENGRMIGTVGCGRDVTEERRVEERLRWNEALLSRMAQASPLAHLVVDNRTDDIHYFNSRFCDMWGLLHLEDELRAGNLRNSDIISLCIPLVKDTEAFAASCTSLQDEANRSIIEDEIEFVDGRCIRRFSTQIRDADDRYFGRLYLFEDITERKKASEALRRHDAIMNAVNFAADRFLKEANWKRLMREVLERFGRATDVSRVYIFENGTDPATGKVVCSQRWEWNAEGVAAGIDSPELRNVPYDVIPRWYEELAAGRPIVGPVRTFPDTERAHLEPRRIQSVAVVPIFVHQQWWGFIGFDESRRERTWSPAEIDALQAAASIIGSAILRTMNEEVYRNPVERSPVGVYLLQDNHLRYFNTRFAEIFGYSRDELLGPGTRSALIAPEYLEDLQRRQQALLSGDTESEHHEFCGVHKDGRIIFLENFATRLQFEGRPGIVGSLVDVTERKLADEALRSSEERLKILFEYAPDAFYLTDMNGIIVDGNRAAEKLSGRLREEFIGKSIVETGFMPRDELPKVEAMLCHLTAGTAAGPTEFISVLKDGTRIFVEITAFPVTIDGQQLVFASARDTSERYLLESLKKSAFLQIEENIEQLAILNDSIRNPLTVIIALAEMGDTEIDRKIIEQAWAIDAIISRLDQGWLVSRKVKEYLKKHYT
ncbi:MAG: PAS domain S-box protein [Methanoculleus sp.]|nr:PAS domain S-box protein [Methanoculleus sp.]